jgi:superfamily II DNA or RNA helicase
MEGRGNPPERPELPGLDVFALSVTFEVAAGAIRFEWLRSNGTCAACGLLTPAPSELPFFAGLAWEFRAEAGCGAEPWRDHCSSAPRSAHALLKRIRQRCVLVEGGLRLGILADTDLGDAKAGVLLPIRPLDGVDRWIWLGRAMAEFARMAAEGGEPTDLQTYARELLRILAGRQLGVAVPPPQTPTRRRLLGDRPYDLEVNFDRPAGCTRFTWSGSSDAATHVVATVSCRGRQQFLWSLHAGGKGEEQVTLQDRNAIRTVVGQWLKRFPANAATVAIVLTKPAPHGGPPVRQPLTTEDIRSSAYPVIEEGIMGMAEGLRPLPFVPPGFEYDYGTDFERRQRREQRKEEKRAEEADRRAANIQRYLEERRRRELREEAERFATPARPAPAGRKSADHRGRPETPVTPPSKAPRPSTPVPPVPVAIKLPPLIFQDTALPLSDLREFALRERGAIWWVSNQSDDLLCLPHCRLERLDYQVRTALRVLGPLRGRALLSDEVGLGKTIEAGLVLKELLTRGMVKRFLVLTLPSLVDQWAEELDDKFGLAVTTTNQNEARDNAGKFWGESPGIVASLHTLKQPAHLAVAREVQWDLLVVDEAHYLRNRDSLAWQAVHVLPRQFLLLLTATPVQNSLEELYNLVTLLMPGQLPTPREFRSRFLDPKRPRQPRAPEELRRLLGQVMIRNTRANAGVDLPPRHAETVLFAPDEAEGAFWRQWETEFRTCLARLNASQASLWGRLLLRAAGSSPAAWRTSLAKFPDRAAARAWQEGAPLESSWRRKCAALPPLARRSGGMVLFTEFLETQAALAEALRSAGVATFVINGATPPPERQPITERFHQNGGALVLTHSGTEGRNLQFCHRLANFDLPWNPMEIEQRIGRLHRLGQRHPVEIYNFVQAGTLQENLLQILQEKLNLFELVVGETGLVLGERFSGDEFEEEIFRRWRESEGRVAEALGELGDELAAARDQYREVRQLDETLFARDYESL